MKKNKLLKEGRIFFMIYIPLSLFILYLIAFPGDFNNKINKLSSNDDFIASGTMLKFNSDMVDYLHESWDNNPNNEYGICMNAEKTKKYNENKSKYIYNVFIVDTMINFKKGNENYIDFNCLNTDIMLHNHPNSGCRKQLWNGDIQGARLSYKQGNIFFLIQCEKDKVEVYTRDDMLNGKIISLSENIYSEEILQ